ITLKQNVRNNIRAKVTRVQDTVKLISIDLMHWAEVKDSTLCCSQVFPIAAAPLFSLRHRRDPAGCCPRHSRRGCPRRRHGCARTAGGGAGSPCRPRRGRCYVLHAWKRDKLLLLCVCVCVCP